MAVKIQDFRARISKVYFYCKIFTNNGKSCGLDLWIKRNSHQNVVIFLLSKINFLYSFNTHLQYEVLFSFTELESVPLPVEQQDVLVWGKINPEVVNFA